MEISMDIVLLNWETCSQIEKKTYHSKQLVPLATGWGSPVLYLVREIYIWGLFSILLSFLLHIPPMLHNVKLFVNLHGTKGVISHLFLHRLNLYTVFLTSLYSIIAPHHQKQSIGQHQYRVVCRMIYYLRLTRFVDLLSSVCTDEPLITWNLLVRG